METARLRARRALGSRDFRYLLAARLLSQFADGLFQSVLVAVLVFFAPEQQDTALGLAKVFLVLTVPYSLVGPFSGVLIDRWSRRSILSVTPLVRAGAVALAVALPREGPALYAVALVTISLNRFYLSTAGASLPSLVEERDLLVANSMATVGGTVATFGGLVAGTQVADLVGVRPMLVAVVLAWVVAASLASRIGSPLRPKRGPQGAPPIREDVRQAFREVVLGFRRLRATPPALGSIVSVSYDQVLVGIFTVLSIVVFKDRFHEGVASYGRILAAGGVGVLAGTLTVGVLESRTTKPRIVAAAFGAAGAAALGAAAFLAGITVLILSFVIGLTYAYRKIPVDTIVQEEIPDRYRGRVFAAYDLLFSMSRVLGVALAVPLVPRLSTGQLTALVGLAYLLFTPVLPRWVRRGAKVEVRFYAGGRADEVPRALVIGGEEEPVRVERSWLEEVDGVRRRRFLLRTDDGETLEVVGAGDGAPWFARRVEL